MQCVLLNTASSILPSIACRPAAKEHGLEHELLSAQQVAQRFPACRLPPGFQTLYEPQAGFLAPEKCIEALLSLAQEQHGAQLMCGAKVLGWRVVEQAGGGSSNVNGSGGGALVEVRTSCGTFSARRLVLAGGAWMPQLVPELAPLLTVERQVVGWFSVSPQSRRHFTPANFPVFLLVRALQRLGAYCGCLHGRVRLLSHLACVWRVSDIPPRGSSPVLTPPLPCRAARRPGLLVRLPRG